MSSPSLSASATRRDTALGVLIFMIFFVSFTQYDLIALGRPNYLLISTPVLLILVLTAQIRTLGRVMISKSVWPFVVIYPVLGLWVLRANEMVSFFNYVMLAAIMLFAALFALLCERRPHSCARALRLFIWSNIAAIMIQVAWQRLTQTQIDLHHMLFPFSRHSEISAQDGFGFLRFNGYQLEPGSFAANVGTATMIYFGITRRLPLVMTALVLLSLLITRSASALLYVAALSATAYAIAFRANPSRTLKATPALILLLIGAVYASGFADYLGNRFLDQNLQQITSQDGSARYKVANLTHLASSDIMRQILGSGFMKVDCDGCGFVNSNGAGFAMVFFFGLMGAAMIAAVLCVGLLRSFGALVLVGMLILCRHTFVQPMFWIPVMLLCVNASFMSQRKAKDEYFTPDHPY